MSVCFFSSNDQQYYLIYPKETKYVFYFFVFAKQRCFYFEYICELIGDLFCIWN